jgi:pilus assembly protein CpaF
VPQPSGRQPAANAAGRESGDERFVRLKKEIHKQLVTGLRMPVVNAVNDYELRQELRRGVEQICQARGELMSQEERERLTNEIIDETLGLGPIDPLLRDPTITDILINGPRTVYVERRGRLERTNVAFHDEQHVLEIVQRIASRVGRRLDE